MFRLLHESYKVVFISYVIVVSFMLMSSMHMDGHTCGIEHDVGLLDIVYHALKAKEKGKITESSEDSRE